MHVWRLAEGLQVVDGASGCATLVALGRVVLDVDGLDGCGQVVGVLQAPQRTLLQVLQDRPGVEPDLLRNLVPTVMLCRLSIYRYITRAHCQADDERKLGTVTEHTAWLDRQSKATAKARS